MSQEYVTSNSVYATSLYTMSKKIEQTMVRTSFKLHKKFLTVFGSVMQNGFKSYPHDVPSSRLTSVVVK